MRRKFLVLAFMAMMIFPAELPAVPRLAVRKFDNKTDNPSVPSSAITDMMITELGKARIFILTEREAINYAADEIRFSQSGLVDKSTAIEARKITGAQYSMTGAITMHFYNEKGGNELFRKLTGGIPQEKTAYVMLDIRIIDNTTGEDIYAHNELGSARRSAKVSAKDGITRSYGGELEEAARDAVKKHVAEMSRYSWE
ncbi:MAG: hypothetical protein IJP86_02535 [Synergistaceae bacterium]|nr:hypothetical protein [Synergistaceae bacterium]